MLMRPPAVQNFQKFLVDKPCYEKFQGFFWRRKNHPCQPDDTTPNFFRAPQNGQKPATQIDSISRPGISVLKNSKEFYKTPLKIDANGEGMFPSQKSHIGTAACSNLLWKST
jgi:hypothetical protein